MKKRAFHTSKTCVLTALVLLALGHAPCWAAEEAPPKAATERVSTLPPPAADKSAPADAKTTDEKNKPASVADLILAPLPEEEKALYDWIQNAFKGGDSGGAEALKGRKPLDLSIRAAAYRALERNLDIKVSAHEDQFLRAALQEAQAALLPVFDVSAQYDVDATFTRKRTAIIATKFIPFRFPPSIAIPAPSPIIRIDFVPGRAPGTKLGFQFASKRGANGPVRKGTFKVGVSQLLPWGPSFNLTSTMVHKESYTDKEFHKYDAPWTTTVSADVTLPIPFTKNFGPFAPQDTVIKLANLDKERAAWDLMAAINATLTTVDLAYWDLVNSLKLLEVTAENRKTLEVLAEKTAQLLASGRTTAYGKDQVDAEVLRVKDLEEQTWNRYIAASNVLVDLLDLEESAVLVPHGYSRNVNEHLAIQADSAVAVGLAQRPELKAEALKTQASEIDVKFRKQQKKPDLTYTASGALIQSNSEIGYPHLLRSYANVFRADNRSQSNTMTYVYAFGQRAEHAGLRGAQSRLEEQKLANRSVENQVAWDISDALSAVESAKGRVASAKVRLDAARKAYDLAVTLKEAGRLTEYEIVSKSQEWLDALNAHVVSHSDYKKAETSFLGAQGTLLMHYPEMTAHTDFERYRLELLQSTQTLQFFRSVGRRGRIGTP